MLPVASTDPTLAPEMNVKTSAMNKIVSIAGRRVVVVVAVATLLDDDVAPGMTMTRRARAIVIVIAADKHQYDEGTCSISILCG